MTSITENIHELYPNWTVMACHYCNGRGLVLSYSGEPDECRRCGGSGQIWRSPKGRLAEYPGGRFLGRDDG